MSRRRRNQNRYHIPRNAQYIRTVNTDTTPSTARSNSTEEAPPAYEPQGPPLEPPPIYFEQIPRVRIEQLPEQTSHPVTHNRLVLCCRKWQFETIVDYAPVEFMSLHIFAAIFRIETYSGDYNTVVGHFPKTISEFHVIQATEGGAEILGRTGYRVVLPERPWPMDGLRAANRDEYC